jgi:hypothetical protein
MAKVELRIRRNTKWRHTALVALRTDDDGDEDGGGNGVEFQILAHPVVNEVVHMDREIIIIIVIDVVCEVAYAS